MGEIKDGFLEEVAPELKLEGCTETNQRRGRECIPGRVNSYFAMQVRDWLDQSAGEGQKGRVLREEGTGFGMGLDMKGRGGGSINNHS